ncbi:MAG: EAL domain-containing protein [Burkholderiaceae bacterium]
MDDSAPVLAASAPRAKLQTPLRELLRLLTVGCACAAGSWLGLLAPSVPPFISLFWPPAGIALAALLCWGPRMGWAVLAGGLGSGLLLGGSPLLGLALGGCSLAGPMMAQSLLRRLGFRPELGRRRHLGPFLLLGCLAGPLISAASGVIVLRLAGALPEGAMAGALCAWWGGDAMGVLAVGASLLGWADWRLPRWPPLRRLAGTASLVAAALGSAALLFFGRGDESLTPSPWLFLPHLLLCGLALRSSLALASTSALLLGLMALAATALQLGPLHLPPQSGPGGAVVAPQALLLLWGYMGTAALVPLLTCALTRALRDEQRHWREALEAADIGAAEWARARADSALLPHQASPTWLRLMGEAQPGDRTVLGLDAVHPLDRERLQHAVAALLGAGGPPAAQQALRLGGAAGEWRWHQLRLQVPERDGRGRALRLLGTLIDIGAQHTAEERERISASLFQHLQEGVLVTDVDLRILDTNPAYCRIAGLPREQLLGQRAAALEPAALLAAGLDPATLQQAIQQRSAWQARVHRRRADGTPSVQDLRVSAIAEPDGPLRYLVITVDDVTEALRQQDRLEHQARFDLQTGLPNELAFTEQLRSGLLASEREGFCLVICRLDLDQFGAINQQHGAEAADALLRLAAQRLRGALRSGPQWSDVLARLGGDEFGLLLRANDAAEAQLALERLLKVLRQPSLLGPPLLPAERALTLTASIGATQFPQDRADAETLLRHAGHALYRAKQHSDREGLRFFDSAKRLREEASLIELARVQQALDAGELLLHYQPKIDMQGGEVLGMEALLRWQHPQRGLLGPGQFLPLVEASGLGLQIGDWVLEQALRQSAQWLAAGHALQLSVNVTARQLQASDFALRLQELLARHAEPVARHLSLEVLESAALADVDATHALIQRCRALGVRFALDDFGTGYSTLTYLKRLPVDALKIDRSFVQGMLADAQDRALVEGVIGLARNFGCEVVAEGVESAAHAGALLRLGCHLGQGNGIAAAMPATEVPGWIAAFAVSPWHGQADPAMAAFATSAGAGEPNQALA